jgi:hypothetical protein
LTFPAATAATSACAAAGSAGFAGFAAAEGGVGVAATGGFASDMCLKISCGEPIKK